MSSPKLIIRHQTLPTRCEICHQSDVFDPATGQCRRCAEMVTQMVATQSAAAGFLPPAENLTRLELVATRLLVGVFYMIVAGAMGIGAGMILALLIGQLAIILVAIGGLVILVGVLLAILSVFLLLFAMIGSAIDRVKHWVNNTSQ
ncbi:MAG TPA: hypothetical protein PLL06_17425 [Acidobacteriota bacterium]|nr:hypothetical protein [Acidobacteriota bacterium]